VRPASRRPLIACLAVLGLGALAAGGAFAGEGEPVRKIVARLPFEEAELILKTEAQRQNLSLVTVLDIKKGMENRGGTFRPYKIYQFCNLELGIRIYSDAPDYGAFQLCSVLIYEVEPGRTALVSARQGWVLGNLPGHRPGVAAEAAARQFERIIDEIFEAVLEEARARRR
jgi:uncharacterized protein (DUF302 family)